MKKEGCTTPFAITFHSNRGHSRSLSFPSIPPPPTPLKGIVFFFFMSVYYYGAPYNLQFLARPTIPFICSSRRHIERCFWSTSSGNRTVPRNIPEIQHYRARARAIKSIRFFVREKSSVESKAVLTGG